VLAFGNRFRILRLHTEAAYCLLDGPAGSVASVVRQRLRAESVGNDDSVTPDVMKR
jgi:hypothetical protein